MIWKSLISTRRYTLKITVFFDFFNWEQIECPMSFPQCHYEPTGRSGTSKHETVLEFLFVIMKTEADIRHLIMLLAVAILIDEKCPNGLCKL
jgi:hypothetical protein